MMLKVRAPGVALAIASLLIGSLACVSQLERDPSSPTPGVTDTPEPTSAATITASPSATPSPTPGAGVTPTPSATPTNIPVSGGIQRGLFLEIEGISDESIVRGDSVIARGQTASDAVVSINGVIISVEPDGSFEVLLALNPGPNLIEVVASNLDGEELSRVIAVVSLPEEPTPTATTEGGTSS